MSDTNEDGERVKKIIVDRFDHTEAGVKMSLNQMSLYLLNEEDFGISPADFRPERHEHAIPKYEMARIMMIVCASTGDRLGFAPEERDDPVYQMYERAYQSCLASEYDTLLLRNLRAIGKASGFSDLPEGELPVPAH